ncbi:MAG: type II toxin-antitoxin system RelE/ParE family toxin [Patescibacteria group bacterium]|nr:type II toxin-antitoxin system RelE/ParE family toxin [Patescibacteria group bacterium]
MTYTIEIEPKAEKELAKLPKRDHDRILVGLAALSNNPYTGKKLRGKHESYYSMRVWPYRIIYKIFNKQLFVVVIRIAQRESAYS